jgi:hypothetical protein
MTITIAQAEAASHMIDPLTKSYGLAALGLVSLIVVCTLLIAAWKWVGNPALTIVLDISKHLSTATGNIKDTSASQERMGERLAESIKRSDDQHARMERLLSSIRGEGE